jgi:hypothetical protein
MNPIDITRPRECTYQQFDDQPGPCPRCGAPLHPSTQTYLVATRHGGRMADSFVVSGDIGWFCTNCPTVVINPAQVSEMLQAPVRRWDVGMEYAVLGILNLDAIPPEQRHLPLGEVDPLPLVPFRDASSDRSARPGRKARQKPTRKRKRKRKR